MALGGRTPLLVTDRGIVKAGLAELVVAGWSGFDGHALFDGVTENPLFDDVESGLVAYRENGCDCVVALGGGSAIDTAKFIALIAANDGTVGDYVGGPTEHKRCALLAVLPTTAGTGSEASPDAGIHPDAESTSIGMSSRHIVPDLAILDPELTVSLPPRLTAATGIDAISHCIEGYLSKQAVPLFDGMLLDAIATTVKFLPVAIADGRNLEARGALMLAAFAGGIGIAMGLGPAHAVAIACGDQGFHHGVLSGIGLVCTSDAIAPFAPERADALKQALGAETDASLSQAIAGLMRSLGLPATLAELGYRAGDVATLGGVAHATPFNLTARHHFSAGEFAAMIDSSLT